MAKSAIVGDKVKPVGVDDGVVEEKVGYRVGDQVKSIIVGDRVVEEKVG